MDEQAYQKILNSKDIYSFIKHLDLSNCTRCSLSEHDNNIVTHRGNPAARIMLIGEAPGLEEDKRGKAFVGPAGQLCDKIFASVGISTDLDMYLTNTCRCRPVAIKGSGKQNYTPLASQRKNCIPYVQREIELINPQIVIMAGLTAAKTIMEWNSQTRMGDVAGKFFDKDNRLYFVIYHPAYLIHVQRKGKEESQRARQKMWNHVKILRAKVDALGIKVHWPATGDL